MLDEVTSPILPLGESRSEAVSAAASALAALRRFAKPQVRTEVCELCGTPLWPRHNHLVELKARRLVCCCDACAVLFSAQQHPLYRRVPQRRELLADFRLSDAQWDNLQIPINLAFFFYSTAAGRVLAVYPSPGGAMESLLRLEAWQSLCEENPELNAFEPDVEALLVNRLGQAGEHYRVPIDECYRLIGLIRRHWRGLSGGGEVWENVRGFFAQLKEQSCST